MKEFYDKYSIKIDERDTNDPRVLMLRYIESGKRILDVGCASGDLGVLLKKEKLTKFLVGIDIREEALNIASSKDVYDELLCSDLDETGKLGDFIKGEFDYIIFADVLEHLRSPVENLKYFQNFLATDGKILAIIPNVSHASIKSNLLINDFTYTDVGLLDSTHIHLFTYKTIASELAQAGLLIKDSSFTQRNIYGWQPGDPYSQLPDDVKRYIFSDLHSQVCQYVLFLEPSSLSRLEIQQSNIDKLDIKFNEAPEIFNLYRKELMNCISDSYDARIINSIKQAFNDDISDVRSNIVRLNNIIADMGSNVIGFNKNISILENVNRHSVEMLIDINRMIEEVKITQGKINRKLSLIKYINVSIVLFALFFAIYFLARQ